MTLPTANSLKRLSLTLVLGLGLSLLASSLYAQEGRPTNQPSVRASNDLGKLQPYIDAKNWDGAITLLNGMLRYAVPNSYDQAMVYDIISKIYLQKSDYTASLAPMERAYNLGETYKFFDSKSQLYRLYYLSQLYYEEASNAKDPSLRSKYFIKASTYIETWLNKHPNPTPDGRLFYTSLLYNRAVLDPDNVDKDLLRRSQEQVQEGLVSTLNPKDSFYVIYLASLLQEENYLKAAEVLELLVKQYPSKSTYWQQLMGVYINLSIETEDPEESLKYNIRAILTIERAQSFGHLNTQKYNYQLVGLYFNIQKFGKATELLYKGLSEGSIESDQKKWELLAYSYQQINREFQAIDVLKEASKIYPTAGQLDNQIAQIYYSLDKAKDTYRHLNLALAKGNLTRAGDLYYFKAYICFELLKYEEALVAIDKSAEVAEKPNPQLPRLRAAIVAAIAERKAVKAQATEKSS